MEKEEGIRGESLGQRRARNTIQDMGRRDGYLGGEEGMREGMREGDRETGDAEST